MLFQDCKWTGLIGVYPDHGHFKMPEWVFEELENDKATPICGVGAQAQFYHIISLLCR